MDNHQQNIAVFKAKLMHKLNGNEPTQLVKVEPYVIGTYLYDYAINRGWIDNNGNVLLELDNIV